jgi:penicillin-binding protein 2
MKRSNDIFFYKVGEFVGAEKVADWARMYGFESTGGLEKMGAATGLIPDPEWKERYKGERWFLGNTYHMAIGQGDVLVSPMQVARMTGAVAANGALCPLRFVTDETQGTSCMQMNLQQTTLSLIKEGMREACSEGGTASTFIGFTPRVACKTGTAENASKMELPHAWFTVYAPVDDPQIVLTVMIENAGQGSVEAAPLAKKALEYWFGRSPIDTEGNY